MTLQHPALNVMEGSSLI